MEHKLLFDIHSLAGRYIIPKCRFVGLGSALKSGPSADHWFSVYRQNLHLGTQVLTAVVLDTLVCIHNSNANQNLYTNQYLCLNLNTAQNLCLYLNTAHNLVATQMLLRIFVSLKMLLGVFVSTNWPLRICVLLKILLGICVSLKMLLGIFVSI